MRFDPIVELLIKLEGDEHWWTLGEFASSRSAAQHLVALIDQAIARDKPLTITGFLCMPVTQVWDQPDLPW